MFRWEANKLNSVVQMRGQQSTRSTNTHTHTRTHTHTHTHTLTHTHTSTHIHRVLGSTGFCFLEKPPIQTVYIATTKHFIFI